MDWSPDGNAVAFIGAGYDIFVINADGTGEVNLTNDGNENWWRVSQQAKQPEKRSLLDIELGDVPTASVEIPTLSPVQIPSAAGVLHPEAGYRIDLVRVRF